VVEPEGRGTLARAGHRWKDSLKMNLKGIVCRGRGGGVGLDRSGFGLLRTR
jgi:hypothetical protein